MAPDAPTVVQRLSTAWLLRDVKLAELRQQLYEAGAHAAGKIIEEELLGAPHVLDNATEHPQREHVEQYVREVGVHEHVGEQLVKAEIGRKEEVQAEQIVEVDALACEHPGGEEHQDVDNQQILCYRRNSEHTKSI